MGMISSLLWAGVGIPVCFRQKHFDAESCDLVGDSSVGATNVRMAVMWLLNSGLCSRVELKDLNTEKKWEGW